MNDNGNDRPGESDDEFAARAARLFDDSVQDLDAATRSRLNRSRQRALEAAAAGRPALTGHGWLPAGATAAAVVVALGVVLWDGTEAPSVALDGLPVSVADPAATVAADLDILMDQDSLEMLEDLEFYSWLELDESGDGGDGGENVG